MGDDAAVADAKPDEGTHAEGSDYGGLRNDDAADAPPGVREMLGDSLHGFLF
jgi:hypothetical protein